MTRDEKLGSEKLGKLILSMAIPSVAAQLINALYNIIDRMYIGHIPGYGDLALTGVGVTFSITMLVTAFSFLGGTGGATLAAMKLGKKDYEGAEEVMGVSVALLTIFAVAATAFFAIFKEPILYLFGASDSTITYANEYITIYLMGTLFVQIALGLNSYISAQGQAKIAMLSVGIGAVINIIMDPILIYGLNMGVRGAAIASVFAQMCSAIWVVKFLLSQKSVIKIKRKKIKLNRTIVKNILSLGISPFIMNSTESVVAVALYANLQLYGGDIYVGSMSILLSLLQLIMVPLQGLSYGIQPIMSYNFGAGNRARVVGASKRLFVLSIMSSIFCSGMLMLFPEIFVGLFTTNVDLATLTIEMMPIFYSGMILFGVLMAIQGTFLSLGQVKYSMAIASTRKIVCMAPLAMILPKFVGVIGVYYAEPIADIISILLAVVLFVKHSKRVLDTCGKDNQLV